jgi:hypothetical protein
VQHPLYPGAAVAPSRAHERRPELVRVADGTPAPSLARIRTPFLARIPALRAGSAALLLDLPALALLRPLALYLGPPTLLIRLLALLIRLRTLLIRRPGPRPGFRLLLICRSAVSIRHAASRSRWSS